MGEKKEKSVINKGIFNPYKEEQDHSAEWAFNARVSQRGAWRFENRFVFQSFLNPWGWGGGTGEDDIPLISIGIIREKREGKGNNIIEWKKKKFPSAQKRLSDCDVREFESYSSIVKSPSIHATGPYTIFLEVRAPTRTTLSSLAVRAPTRQHYAHLQYELLLEQHYAHLQYELLLGEHSAHLQYELLLGQHSAHLQYELLLGQHSFTCSTSSY
ncbi:hypothetical protein CEXT_469281 [Caerostris extrusa]|uniref:Uncharacterized protein n=1 Tax=Caerostris extrusa TaxID=172846 RepID=A0AAV4NET7_CAEEX|nr:hypothetical protein CEXT_469281 [Caerostris extrusa]